MRALFVLIITAVALLLATPSAQAAPSLHKRYQCTELHVAKRGVNGYLIATWDRWQGVRVQHVAADSAVLRYPVRVIAECAR